MREVRSRAGEGDLFVSDREIVQDNYIPLSDKPGCGLEVNKGFAARMEGELQWG